ncbi:MAG: DUF1552 domain-containing protein [Nannocystaceae bacterium]|nr:DUF1552 domain-containing protein [bacterium]
MTRDFTRRRLLRATAASALALPFFELLEPGRSRAAEGFAERFIVFYFPDGVVGPSQDGQASLWHATGGGSVELTPQLEPLAPYAGDCVFLNGLTLGPADQGSHPGGAVKLLTAADGGFGESIDHRIARTAGADAPFRHLLLGAMANQNNASGDKHISYPSAGNSLTPQDDPTAAFGLLFDGLVGTSSEPDPRQVTVIDAALDDLNDLRAKLGQVEASKLDYHLESLREVESRIKGVADLPTCDEPTIVAPGGSLYDPANFGSILRAQIDLTVLAMSCGLSRVGVLQCSHHTSDLLMSQFPGTPLYDPGFDMRSHQASHYGPSHDPGSNEFSAYLAQRRYWVEQFGYLLQRLSETPDPVGGTMLENSVVLLCTEVCDGNTHLHDDMPFVLAGQAGGSIETGRVFDGGGQRHAGLLASIAHAMGEPLGGFGDTNTAPLAGLLS